MACQRTTSTVAFSETPPQPLIRGAIEGGDGAGQATAAQPVKPVLPEGFTPEEEIEFTDPDNPAASLRDLSSILTNPQGNRGPWLDDFQQARKWSMRQGKPLLVWFTDSARSPKCRLLDEELFATRDFGTWAGQEVVRVRLDESRAPDDEGLSLDQAQTLRLRHLAQVRDLKRHYRVLGYPSLLLLEPNGRMVEHYRGYTKGDANLLWARLKQASGQAGKAHQQWMKTLEPKGYREWRDRSGRKVFAKLLVYQDGRLILAEPDGTRSRCHESILSDADRQWLRAEKEKAEKLKN